MMSRLPSLALALTLVILVGPSQQQRFRPRPPQQLDSARRPIRQPRPQPPPQVQPASAPLPPRRPQPPSGPPARPPAPPVDRPPVLLPGGDMLDLEIPEDTPVNSVVYTLKGQDPDGSKVSYTVSGDYFSVDRDTGAVQLVTALDRETADSHEVIVTIQDEAFNLIPFRREIRVKDVNDNKPEFLDAPYKFSIDETLPAGEVVFTSVAVADADSGDNARVTLRCVVESGREDDGSCDTFDVQAQELQPGSYVGIVSLKRPVDYESRSSYSLTLEAEDGGGAVSRTSVLVAVNDVQDQKPFFVNAPYSATVEENTPPGSSIFEILARDGDTGEPRNLELSLLGDDLGFFDLDVAGHDEEGVLRATLRAGQENVIDRELEALLSQGGLYAFQILAREVPSDPFQTGDEVVTNVTIVVTDQNDEIPKFNRDTFTVAVPEDVGPDTPLPDLNILVSDGDVSANAAYELVLEDVQNSLGVFTVYPRRAVGRTPVIIRVASPERLDYEREEGRSFKFRVNAMQGPNVLSSVEVNVLVTDSNDNVPVFERELYEFAVPENAVGGAVVGQILATDADSGRFGQVEYTLKGFGAEKFSVDSITGDITVGDCGGLAGLSCLDFETQKSYALTYTATDGGGQVTTTAVTIHVTDVNDNYPSFEQEEYVRVVQELAEELQPALVVSASDADGPTQGGGKIFYAIHSINTDATVFDIDPVGGELRFVQPARKGDTESGRYELVVRATDGGSPTLHRDVKVTVKVGTVSNKRPRFFQPRYEASVSEMAEAGTEVARVAASDPDGEDEELRYVLHSGSKDNFVIDERTGVISVSPEATLDIQRNGDTYDLTVRVVDSGKPFGQTGETTVTVYVEDVNDKKPKFEYKSYTVYVLESTPVGNPVLNVAAFDWDRTAELKFEIAEPITARDKTGNVLSNKAAYDFTSAFRVDPTTGTVSVNEPLSHNSAAVVIVTVKVTDVNARMVETGEVDEETGEKVIEREEQSDTAEATFYIQAFKADSPQFAAPWTPSDPTLTFDVKEQLPGSTVMFKLTAKDPVTGQMISNFEKISTSDPEGLVSISPVTGEVINNYVLDYEERKEGITFQVRAKAAPATPGGPERVSDARVVVNLVDVNDNPPIFAQQEYFVEIPESTLPMARIATVSATDLDAGEFGRVRYSLSGEGSDAFTVDPEEGHVMIKSGLGGRSNLDRERQDEYLLRVQAADMPNGGAGQRTAQAIVRVHVTDVNDSPPEFSSSSRYSAVVPENAPAGTLVITVEAKDPDLGAAGQVHYMFPEGAKQANDLYRIDEETGAIFTTGALTGKGRQAPYVLTVRAMDFGENELFSDTEVYITVGDVSSNDGVPRFIRPEVDEVATVPENASPGSKVFQVLASDPDDGDTANGKIVYSLPDDGTIIRKLFRIDPVTGVLTTRVELDRESRSEYTVILNVADLGSPPQQTSRLLKVRVEDVDDHAPVFERQRNSVPLEVEVAEEVPSGTVIGKVKAKDEDDEENVKIEYAIIDGNDNYIFSIDSNEDNEGVLKVTGRLDREEAASYLLTVKCFRPYEANVKSKEEKYDPMQMDEIQVKVIVQDKDDNSPQFLEHNMTLGVRVNAPIYTPITTLKAVDRDADSNSVYYTLHNLTYFRHSNKIKEILDNTLFLMDSHSGLLQTNATMGRYIDGYFELVLKAASGPEDLEGDYTRLKLYVLQDTELMKFVFDLDPTSVQQRLPAFQEELLDVFAFAQPIKFHLYDTEFYSKVDGSLDFGRTSSCFQVVSDDQVVDLATSRQLLDVSTRPELKELLDKYAVVDVERCGSIQTTAGADWVEICLLVVAALIGVLAIVAALALCCLYSNYKRSLRRSAPVKIIEAPVRTFIPASLPPGSIHHGGGGAPSVAGTQDGGGGGLAGHPGRHLYEWTESTIPMDATSYRSIPNQ